MQLIIEPGGVVRCIYSEHIDLAALGSPAIARASHVEPDQQGRWWADLSPVYGPRLGPFSNRSEALAAEQTWLEKNWLRNAESMPGGICTADPNSGDTAKPGRKLLAQPVERLSGTSTRDQRTRKSVARVLPPIQISVVTCRYEVFCRRQAQPISAMAPTTSRAAVEGSGTETMPSRRTPS